MAEATDDLLADILSAGRLLVWDWDFRSDKVERTGDVEAITGFPSGSAFAFFSRIPAADLDAYHAAVARARAGRVEYELDTELPSGRVARRVILAPILDADGRVAKIFGSAFDITEARQLEERLRQSQKMEAVGQLTGGVAHDFNNLLTAVLGNLELLETEVMTASGRRMIASAKRAAQRGARLTEQLLAFSRKQHLAAAPADINALVRGMTEMLGRTLGGTVTARLDLAPELGLAVLDPTQLELALMNLVINARDAMPQGGTVTIATRNAQVGPTSRIPDLSPGDYTVIAVTDTGTGMSPEVQAKAFDPFFTTKEVGKGTGLGLSQVYGLARQLGGTARIETRLGVGTAVEIWLPRAGSAGPAAAGTGEAPRAAPSAGPTPQSAAVLVVDDDEDVRSLAVASLTAHGYEVIETDGGAAALAIIEGTRPVDVMVVDYAMPGLNGAQLAAETRRRRPSLPFVFITGYADTRSLPLGPEDTLLRKPFRLSDLTLAVDAALTRARRPGESYPTSRSAAT